jgi:cytidylate kinase
VAKEICKILNFTYLSTGLVQRQLAQEMGMNTLEFNKYTDQNKEVDDYIDQKLKDVNDKREPHVLDSRLGWHFVKKSFKIYVLAIEEVAASRVLADEKRIGEPEAQDIQAKMNEQKERRKIEADRFEKYYGVKPSIFRDFDLIIDTSTATIEQVTNMILNSYKRYCEGKMYNKIWLSPKRIFPSKSVKSLADDTNILVENIKHNGFNTVYPVSCVLYQREFYVWDGHKRLSACLKNNLPFVPVMLLAKNTESINPSLTVEQFVKESFSLDKANAWEDEHGFRYFHYPEGLV